ncbi:MAG: hypothetical protein EOP04_05200 [Proteobacteria bacterium]|nr:MAG: hypothetical protein EOP04_05200 [Pseudomonadota bacterium]
MKKLILGLLFVSATAQASWYQELCSNASGSVKTASGHNGDWVQLAFGNDDYGSPILEFVDQASAEVLSEKEIDSSSYSQCEYSSWSRVYHRKIKITRWDGSAFDKPYLGLSKDGLSVTTNVICEEEGSSEWTECKNGKPILYPNEGQIVK